MRAFGCRQRAPSSDRALQRGVRVSRGSRCFVRFRCQQATPHAAEGLRLARRANASRRTSLRSGLPSFGVPWKVAHGARDLAICVSNQQAGKDTSARSSLCKCGEGVVTLCPLGAVKESMARPKPHSRHPGQLTGHGRRVPLLDPRRHPSNQMLTVPRLARAAPPAPALQAAYSSLLGSLTEALSPAPTLAWVEVSASRKWQRMRGLMGLHTCLLGLH